MRAASQISAEPLENRQLLTAAIAGIDADFGVDATDELTNVGTFDLHGTAAASSLLQITRNGTFVGVTLVNTEGEWEFAQTGLAEGDYEFSATDGEGDAALLTVHVDKTAPTATLSTALAQPTNAATLSVGLEFSEAVDGLTLDDLAIGNGTASNLAGSGASYTFDVAVTSDGPVTISLNANAVIDLAGNSNSLSAELSIESDRTAPNAPSVSDPSSSTLTNSSSVTIAGSAEESSLVRLYLDADGSGTLNDGDSQVDLQQLGVGETGFSFNAALTVNAENHFLVTASDLAQNDSAASVVPTITQDSISPTTTIELGLAGPTNSASIPVTVNFSEAVSGFEESDVSVGNGTISDFTSVSPTQATFNVAPAGDGNVTIDIAAGAAADLAGNASGAATQASIVSDSTKPTASFTPEISGATNASPVWVSVQFSEDVSGLDLSDLSITNGSASELTGSGSSYSFSLTPAADGEVAVSLTADAVADAAGNTSVASEYSVVSDRTAPTATIGSTSSSPTNASSIPVSVTFSEEVTGLSSDDFSVTNGSISNFDGSGSSYSFEVTPTTDGEVSVSLNADAATDSAGNTSSEAAFSITSDRTAPGVSISGPVSSPTNASPIDFVVQFDEAVTGLTESDFSVSNGTISSLAGSGSEYHLQITPAADGTVEVSLAVDAASDAAGNTSGSASAATVSDRTAPTVSISSSLSGPTNADSIPVTITFSEEVSGFGADDVSLGNGTLSDFAGSGSSYSFNIVPAGDGAVTVDVASAAAQDSASNDNSAAAQFSIFSDRTAPTFSNVSVPSSGDEGSAVYVELGVSDASAISELSWSAGGGPIFTNGVGYADDNTAASINFTPLDNGTYQATLTATDAAGNTATADVIVEIDNVDPTANADTISLTGEAGDDSVSLIYEDDVLEGEGLLDNDTDPAGENDPLTVVDYDTISEHGAEVTVDSDGSFTYDPTNSEDAQALGAGEVGYDTFSYTISDDDGGESSGTVTVEVHGVNDAPMLNDTTPVRFEAIDANDIYNQGVDIETFALDRIDEVDSNDAIGIAVIGFARATTHGDWQFSTDGGESWTTIDSLNGGHALHLVADGQTRLRLRPDGSHTGTARLTVRAWDGSNDISNGSYAEINSTDETAAYSSESMTLRQTVLSAGRDATIAVSDTFETSTNGDFDRFTAFYEGDDEFDDEFDDDEESDEFFEDDEYNYNEHPEYYTLGGEPQFASASGNVLDNDIDPDTALPDGVSVQFATNLDLRLLGQTIGAPDDVPALAITHFGVLNYESDGSFEYIAEPDFFASLGEGETVVDGFLYFVTDGRSTSNVAAVSILVTGVNDAPFATMELSDAVADEGQGFCLGLPGGLFEDVDTGDSLTVTATKADGDPLPDWLSFNGDQWKFRGTPSEDDLGTIAIRLTATDAHGASTSIDFNLEVAHVNHAPTAGDLENVSVDEGDTLSLPLPLDLFQDPDAGDQLSLSVSDEFGDELPEFFEFDANTGTLTVSPSWTDAGEYLVFVNATDLEGETAATGFVVTVLDTRLSIHVTGHADDPNEAWSLFADDDGLLHITRNGVDEITPVSLNEVFSVTLDTGDGDDIVTLAASLNGVDDEHHGGGDSDDGEDEGGLFINLGAGNDVVDATALSFSVEVFGGEGNDLMFGGSDSDVLVGEAGNDTLFGAGGEDVLLGGDGSDTLRGGAGSDSLDGGADNDLVVGQGGGDLLIGGTGNDTVDGGVGNDSMLGNDGNDSMTGGTGSDVVIGGAGNDTLLGNEGTDTLVGGSGVDSLSGGTSHDIGVGGEGDSTIRGGTGLADVGDVLRGDVETANETFDTTFDWEISSFGVV